MKKYLLTTLLFIAVFIPHFAHADITSNLFSYWAFNDGTGTTASDSSGNGNTGTLTNGPTWSTPGNIWPNDIQYTGSSKTYVISSASITTGTSRTYAVWVKPISLTNTDNFFISGRSSGLFTNNVGEMFFNDRGAVSRDSGTVISSGVWTHVAAVCVFSGGSTDSVTLYVNGSQVAQFTGLTGSCNFNQSLDFVVTGTNGASVTNATYPYTGYEQEARIYTRALTSTDIAQLYAFTAPSTGTFYKFFVGMGAIFKVGGGSVFNTN